MFYHFYYKKCIESLYKARKMAGKGETKTDISSADDSDLIKKRKIPKLLMDCADPSSLLCPMYNSGMY